VKKVQFHIGCSGFYYPQWQGNFYPVKLKRTGWLEYYSRVFNTVELNGTFYRKPKVQDLRRYAEITPPGFRFSAKASRYITHVLKLANAKEVVAEFSALLEEGLGKKFAQLLFQLPAVQKFSEAHLDEICESIPPGEKSVIEFRDGSWWTEKVMARFRERGYTICNMDYPGLQPPLKKTSPVFYMRMHGVPELFKSSYSEAQLEKLAGNLPAGLKHAYIYFNNTYYDAAYKNATRLRELLSKRYAEKIPQ
jgi:uncharacterized protein YecE (DUF72 family)